MNTLGGQAGQLVAHPPLFQLTFSHLAPLKKKGGWGVGGGWGCCQAARHRAPSPLPYLNALSCSTTINPALTLSLCTFSLLPFHSRLTGRNLIRAAAQSFALWQFTAFHPCALQCVCMYVQKPVSQTYIWSIQ